MMQGDSYFLGFSLTNNAGQPITPEDVLDVEITVGSLTKRKNDGKLIYDNGMWMFPLNQAESMEMRPGRKDAQARIKWASGAVEGQPVYGVIVLESKSKEVL